MSAKTVRNPYLKKSWIVEDKRVAVKRSTGKPNSKKLAVKSPFKVDRSFGDTPVNLSSKHASKTQ